jgi:hypothetical protein
MNRILGLCGLVALAAALSAAQTKPSMTGTCSKADVQQSIPAGDKEGHAFALAQGKCSVTGTVNGVAAKEAAYSEHADVTPAGFKNWGIYTVTFANGDKVFYTYQGVATMKDGNYQSGTNRYQVAGGTGAMKSASGSGTCKLTGKPDGSIDYSCAGTSGARAAAKQ